MDYGDNSLLIAMFFIAMRRLRICFLYRLVIQVRLGNSGVTTQLYSWRSKSDGLQRNMYSGIVQNEVVLNDLF